MSQRLMGKKRGMVQAFSKDGRAIPCTVIEFEPNVVVQKKTVEQDGYTATQLGFDKIVTKDERTLLKRITKPLLKHFEKAGVEPRRTLFEVRGESPEDLEIGAEISVEDTFKEMEFVDVQGITKGKGFQGVMKKYNFSGGPASHGSGFHRHAGSTGMRSTPGRCLPGSPRPSRMGGVQQTTQSMEIFKIIPEKNVMLVKGAVPGPVGSNVLVFKAVKK
jgi:large subunit ribosomal protein L3